MGERLSSLRPHIYEGWPGLAPDWQEFHERIYISIKIRSNPETNIPLFHCRLYFQFYPEGVNVIVRSSDKPNTRRLMYRDLLIRNQ